MLHTHSRIWIHLVWTTKKHERIFTPQTGIKLFNFFTEKAKELEIPFEKLNIQPEHIHALFDLPTNKTVADFMHDIKGSSSHWVNQQNLIKNSFSWQRGYGAYSVSASQFKVVSNYIQNQSAHHQKKTFSQEYEEWKREYGIFDNE